MESEGLSSAARVLMGVLYLGLFVLYAAGLWKLFEKAGYPGWYALVPILNTYTLIRVAGRPGWWIWLTFVPCVGFVVMVLVLVELADSFGRGAGFAVGLVLLSPIFLPILGFGSSEYLSGDAYDRRLAAGPPLPTPPTPTWNHGTPTAAAPRALPSLQGSAPPPAGWYPDPAGAGGQRWWDGTAWTTHTSH